MFSRMSSKRRIGFLEGNDSIPFNAASQAVFPYGLRNDIHGGLQNFRQSPTERIEPAEIREPFTASLAGQLHHNIDVGIVALLAPCSRPKQSQARHAGSAKLALMRP